MFGRFKRNPHANESAKKAALTSSSGGGFLIKALKAQDNN
tara:strand:+ start:75 stop:194 length:120 start_codon:yes stop_codon:yes gene_type:complete